MYIKTFTVFLPMAWAIMNSAEVWGSGTPAARSFLVQSSQCFKTHVCCTSLTETYVRKPWSSFLSFLNKLNRDQDDLLTAKMDKHRKFIVRCSCQSQLEKNANDKHQVTEKSIEIGICDEYFIISNGDNHSFIQQIEVERWRKTPHGRWHI